MNIDSFRTTPAFRRFKYQRCCYLIRPRRDDALFGSSAQLWLKAGVARTNLWNRLRSYKCYWPAGVDILAVATVRQPDDFEGEAITVVEKHVLSKVRRLRPGCESLRPDQAAAAIAAMREHRFTGEVWVAQMYDNQVQSSSVPLARRQSDQTPGRGCPCTGSIQSDGVSVSR